MKIFNLTLITQKLIFSKLGVENELWLTSGSQTLSWTLNLVGDGSDYSVEKDYNKKKKKYILNQRKL